MKFFFFDKFTFQKSPAQISVVISYYITGTCPGQWFRPYFCYSLCLNKPVSGVNLPRPITTSCSFKNTESLSEKVKVGNCMDLTT